MRVINAIIYHNPTCSNSIAALEYLKKHNMEADIKLYMDAGIVRAEISEILELLNCHITDIISVVEQIFADNYILAVLMFNKKTRAQYNDTKRRL